MSKKAINKVISACVPVLNGCAKIFAKKPKELISLSKNGFADKKVYLTAHRGVTQFSPENTLPAYEEAVRRGYYSAECDIVLTKDKKWVLSHNEDMSIRLWQVGNYSDYTLEEVQKFSFKNGTNHWNKALHVPTLEEFLDVFVGSETRPQIEIKGDNIDDLKKVIKAVHDRGMGKQAIIISFNLDQLKKIRSIDDEIELWYLIGRIDQKAIDEVKTLGNAWFSPHFAQNDAESIQLAIDNGVKCSFWTVNSVKDAEFLYNLGIHYMETDIICN
ncbi:MAG: hypothetical protein IJZ57_06920 [Clostridia bacterium]|nr:hypothetical protein [Clostridia bacterium]